MAVGEVKCSIHKGAYRTLPYYGGKRGWGLAEWIAGLLPWSADSLYCEPFAGMAGVLLARKPVTVELLNDLNGRVVNWWRAVRDCPQEFGWLVEHTPFSRDEYRWACAAVDDPDLPDIRRALAFHILVSQCINHGDNSLSQGSWRRRFQDYMLRHPHQQDEIVFMARRLQTVQLESIDGLTLLERIKGYDHAVIYCDPPYPTANTSPYALGRLDFDRLADLLRSQKGAVAVSGYPGEWDCLGWAAESLRHGRSQINGKVMERTEVLWRNARCVELATVRQLL